MTVTPNFKRLVRTVKVLVASCAVGAAATPLFAQHGGGGGMGGMGGMGGGHMGGGFGGGHVGGGYVGAGHAGGISGGTHFGVGSSTVGHVGGVGSGWTTVHSATSPSYGAHFGYAPTYHSGPIYGGVHYSPTWHYGSAYGLYHSGYGGYSHWSYSWHPYYHHAYPVYYSHAYFGSYWSGYYYPYYYPSYSVTYYDTRSYGYVTASSTNSYASAYNFSGTQTATPRDQTDIRIAPRIEIQTQDPPEALPDENWKKN